MMLKERGGVSSEDVERIFTHLHGKRTIKQLFFGPWIKRAYRSSLNDSKKLQAEVTYLGDEE